MVRPDGCGVVALGHSLRCDALGCTNTKPRAYDRTGTSTQKHSE